MEKMEKANMLYKGKLVSVWEEEEHINLWLCQQDTVFRIPRDDYNALLLELFELVKVAFGNKEAKDLFLRIAANYFKEMYKANPEAAQKDFLEWLKTLGFGHIKAGIWKPSDN